MSKQMLVEVEHVQAHRTKKDKKVAGGGEMSHFKKSVTDGKENADELAKAGAMLDEGFMAETRAKTVSLQYAACFSLSGREIERLTLKDSSRSHKKNGSSWIRKVRKRSIEWNGVQMPASIYV